MSTKHDKVYPECEFITRTLEVGGLAKAELIEKLQQYSIKVNEFGDMLLADDTFTTSDKKYSLQIVELTVSDLGFTEGATINEIFNKANDLGLGLCPLEVAPYLRLDYLDQSEGNVSNSSHQNQAPSGSVTIASKILTDDHDFPKGFYLRRINGVLWLRGYCADYLHVWNPGDRFIFNRSEKF